MRGALHFSRVVRHRKIQSMSRYADKHSVLHLQETHGTQAELRAAFSRFSRRFHVFVSSCTDCPSSGGLVSLVNKSHHVGWSLASEVIVPGRLLKVVATRDSLANFSYPSGVINAGSAVINAGTTQAEYSPSPDLPSARHIKTQNQNFQQHGVVHKKTDHPTCVYINVHNHGITSRQLSAFIRKDKPLVLRSRAQPSLLQYSIAGDFNLRPPGYSSQRLNHHDRSIVGNIHNHVIPHENPARRPLEGLWNSFLSLLTEVLDKQHTHICIQNMSTSRIDRIFNSLPKSLLINTYNSSGIARTPVEWLTDDISDHSLAWWSCLFKPKGSYVSPRLRPAWCRHPRFREICDFYFAAQGFQDCSLHDRLSMCKDILTYSALQARNHILHNEPLSRHTRLAALCSTAKAVWTQDKQLAHRLVQHSRFADSHLHFINGLPCLRDAATFDRELALGKIEYLERVKQRYSDRQSGEGVSPAVRAKSRDKIGQLERQAALWRPTVPYFALAGITIGSERVVGSRVCGIDSMCPELRRAWAPIFSSTGMHEHEAKKLLEVYCRNVTWQWNEVVPPTQETVNKTIDRSLNHAPGLDGTCDAAWANSGPVPRSLVHELSCDLSTGNPPHPFLIIPCLCSRPKKLTSMVTALVLSFVERLKLAL